MSPFEKFSEHALVSAVIPTRGRPDLLVCAIRSALRQTWRPLEVIVVSHGIALQTGIPTVIRALSSFIAGLHDSAAGLCSILLARSYVDLYPAVNLVHPSISITSRNSGNA